MNTIINELLKNILEAGLGWQVLIVSILIIIQILAFIGGKNLLVLWKAYRNANSDNPLKNDKNSKKRQMDLFNHSLFFTMNHLVNHKVKMMNFGDGNRNKIFRTLLELKIKSICNHSKQLIEENDLTNMDKLDFKSLVFKNFTSIIDDYNNQFKERFGEDLYGLILQHSEKGFNNWHENVVVYTHNLVDDICDSELYADNIERMYAIFNSYHSAIDATLVNVEKTFHSFNGELDALLKKQSFQG